jgi:hypothetical protein
MRQDLGSTIIEIENQGEPDFDDLDVDIRGYLTRYSDGAYRMSEEFEMAGHVGGYVLSRWGHKESRRTRKAAR